MTAGRKSIGTKPMTAAERKRRQRAKAKEMGIPSRDQVVFAFGRTLIEIMPDIKDTALLEQLEKQTAQHLSKLGFKNRLIREALQKVRSGDGTD
ncbi:hypothetical protein V5T82_09745 [Magnetovibrio sp. PR-2]|uniref:hypothetical protein n=1 Tax=Magnetovibrio sp. PR-2 TaxID=3120356 RepID=UPI002FCE0AD8